MGEKLTISIHKGIKGLESIKESWIELYVDLSHKAYYQDWHWMFLLLKWLIKDPVYFLVLHKNEKIALILPLQERQETNAGVRQQYFSFPTHNHIVLSDALINAEMVGEEDFKHLITNLTHHTDVHWSYLQLNSLSASSDFLRAAQACDFHTSETSSSAYFDWPNGNFDETLSKKFIKNIRRLGKRAENKEGLVEAFFVNEASALDQAFETFLDLEASGWKGESGTSTAIKHHSDLVSFYRDLAASFSRDGSFQINILEIGGRPDAAQMCIRVSSTWYILKVAYLEEMKVYGAGNLLMLKFLEYASDEAAITEVNLLTSPAWADRWHLKKRPVFCLQYFNSSVKGRLTEAYINTKNKMKALIK